MFYRRGFTIVELLIVIVVIAILAAISIVAYNGIQQRAKTSAVQSEMSQLQKKIRIDTIQQGNEVVSLKAPLAYLTKPGTSLLAEPIKNGQEVSLYVVFDTTGNLASSWGPVAQLTPNANSSNGFSLRASNPGESTMNGFFATSAQANQSIHQVGIRSTTGRHVGWITATAGTVMSGYDSNTGTSNTLATHNGWNFTDISLFTPTGASGVATVVFPEYHNEAARQQILRWLDREYTIDYYN